MVWGALPFTAEFRYMVEYATTKNQSIQIGASYLGKSPVLSIIENSIPSNGTNTFDFFVSGYRIQAWNKLYLTQLGDDYSKSNYLSPQGFYVAPQISFATAVFTDRFLFTNNVYIRNTHFNANLMIGGQMFLGNLAIDIFTGFGYKNNTWVERRSSTSIQTIDPADLGFGSYYTGPFKFNLGFNVGYGF